jgi:hypothetical protein
MYKRERPDGQPAPITFLRLHLTRIMQETPFPLPQQGERELRRAVVGQPAREHLPFGGLSEQHRGKRRLSDLGKIRREARV